MRSRLLLASLLLGGLASPAGSLEAANIITHGTECHNYNASQALDIDYFSTGVVNINASARTVICPVPRSPLAAGATPRFNVSGRNNPGTNTTCTLSIHDSTGVFVASQSFTIPGGGNPPLWILNYSFAVGAVSASDNVALLCTLPGGAAGIVYSITSVQ